MQNASLAEAPRKRAVCESFALSCGNAGEASSTSNKRISNKEGRHES